MLQLVIENAPALTALLVAVTSVIAAACGLVNAVADAIVKVAPLFGGKVNHRARRVKRVKRVKRGKR